MSLHQHLDLIGLIDTYLASSSLPGDTPLSEKQTSQNLTETGAPSTSSNTSASSCPTQQHSETPCTPSYPRFDHDYLGKRKRRQEQPSSPTQQSSQPVSFTQQGTQTCSFTQQNTQPTSLRKHYLELSNQFSHAGSLMQQPSSTTQQASSCNQTFFRPQPRPSISASTQTQNCDRFLSDLSRDSEFKQFSAILAYHGTREAFEFAAQLTPRNK